MLNPIIRYVICYRNLLFLGRIWINFQHQSAIHVDDLQCKSPRSGLVQHFNHAPAHLHGLISTLRLHITYCFNNSKIIPYLLYFCKHARALSKTSINHGIYHNVSYAHLQKSTHAKSHTNGLKQDIILAKNG